jgi:hypothetical protein
MKIGEGAFNLYIPSARLQMVCIYNFLKGIIYNATRSSANYTEGFLGDADSTERIDGQKYTIP